MHFKSLVATTALSALVAQGSAYTLQSQGNQSGMVQAGMTQATEYVSPNLENRCFSVNVVNRCEEGYSVKSSKKETVAFHCVSRNSAQAQRWSEKVENKEIVPEMNGKTTHIYARVQVPTKCVEDNKLSKQEQRRRKIQQQPGNRVEIIEENLKEFDQENQWEQDELTTEEDYNQYRKSRRDEDHEWQKMQSLFNQYPELTQKKLHQLIKSDESKYQQVKEQLNELVQQKTITSHLMPQIQTTLPVFFSDVAKQVFKAMQEQKQQNEQNNVHHRVSVEEQQQPEERLHQLVGTNQEYKQLMQRAYVYIVKEAVKLNAQAPQRLANVPELARKVWEKLQRTELTRAQIEQVNEVQQKVEQLLESDKTNQIISEDLVSESLKASHKQARKNMMRVIITTLMMENQPTFERSQNFEQQY